ncbi:hypothetical protein E2C01_018037 [Portunus trituberculatus]|uniref:Uncharacterized protein n=1 Tax=Portunus trituberculatus TaxID=210409 RepID=A0A5B7DVE9_PORTR|nr:hypothetical protein [Portunus trituberculatus]
MEGEVFACMERVASSPSPRRQGASERRLRTPPLPEVFGLDLYAGGVWAKFLWATHVLNLEFLESSVTTDQLYSSWLLGRHGRRISNCHIFPARCSDAYTASLFKCSQYHNLTGK